MIVKEEPLRFLGNSIAGTVAPKTYTTQILFSVTPDRAERQNVRFVEFASDDGPNSSGGTL